MADAVVIYFLACLSVKPQEKSVSETFYGMKEGTSNEIRIKFRANPRPSEGQWSVGDVSVPVGASSIDQKFESSQFIDGVNKYLA